MSSTGSPDTSAPDPGAPEMTRDAELHAARRSLILFVLAVAAAAIGLIVVLNGWADEDAADTRVGTGEIEAAREIGPDAGAAVAAYVDERRGHLNDVEGRRAAVVSFTSYVTEDEVSDLLGDSVNRDAMLMALPGDSMRATASVAEARDRAVADAQVDEIVQLVPTVEDEEFASFYRAELIRYRKVIAEADRDDVVFGAVVVGRAGDLRGLASRAGVRLVDVGDTAEVPDADAVTGLRPEESLTTGEPPFRP